MNRKQKRILLRILAAACMLLLLALTGDFRGKAWLYLIPYFAIGYDILADAFHGIVNGQPFDENFLMAVATVGAMALGEYTEGVAVMLFYQVGELFQSVAVGKSRRSIAALMDLRPDSAEVERGGELITVEPDEVAIGEIIVVAPGGRIPIDGVVIEGSSTLNTAALTGESVPRSVHASDTVQSGCINESGVLRIRTTKEFGESTASKILDLVENASSLKSRSENFITKFARVYTPAVCFSALALFLVPPLVSLLCGGAAGWGVWLYRALTFLVISCPCALVISIPLTFFAGLGGASRAGVLIKGSNYMETLAKVRCVVFDKTGTLTKGVFEVSRIYPAAMEREELLDLAAHAECASTHPIARSLLRALGHEPDRSRTGEIEELSGYGVTAKVDGKFVAAGNLALMSRMKVPCEPCAEAGTAVYVAANGEFAGCILISDEIKPAAAESVRKLRRSGIKNIIMLTGDNENAAEAVAAELGVDEFHARLLPADKVAKVEELLGAGIGAVAFVGDGINDAPVLMRSDVGIAMGALGSDAAIEAADVVLMDDDPRRLADAIAISSKVLRIVYENIVFAIAVKLACLVLGALGITNMWAAIFADVGVMVLAVLNALRAMRRGRREE